MRDLRVVAGGAQQEVTEFHRFQELSEELVSINQHICELRPVERQRGGWTAAAIHTEVACEVDRLLARGFAERHHHGRTDPSKPACERRFTMPGLRS